MIGKAEKVFHSYTDTAGRVHYLIAIDDTTSGVKEYIVDKSKTYEANSKEITPHEISNDGGEEGERK